MTPHPLSGAVKVWYDGELFVVFDTCPFGEASRWKPYVALPAAAFDALVSRDAERKGVIDDALCQKIDALVRERDELGTLLAMIYRMDTAPTDANLLTAAALAERVERALVAVDARTALAASTLERPA